MIITQEAQLTDCFILLQSSWSPSISALLHNSIPLEAHQYIHIKGGAKIAKNAKMPRTLYVNAETDKLLKIFFIKILTLLT